MGPFSDRLAQLVSGERDPSAPLPTYVTSSTAIAANGLLSAALANGGEIAQARRWRLIRLSDRSGDTPVTANPVPRGLSTGRQVLTQPLVALPGPLR